MKHSTLVNALCRAPARIERHFRPLFKEFSMGHGRIDIIGRDRKGTVCLVEVKTRNSKIKQGEKQVKSYRQQLLQFLSMISIEFSIRALVATPNKVVDLGTVKTQPIHVLRIPTDVPTSREIYGLNSTQEAEK